MGNKVQLKKKHSFNVGTFNVRGMSKEQKQEQLARDITKFNVDVCCLQETKIKENFNREVEGNLIITFETDQKDYGNGFVINRKWKNSIHRFWKVSDRICVIQLAIQDDNNKKICMEKEKFTVTKVNFPKMTLTKVIKTEEKHFIISKSNFPKMSMKAEKNKRLITVINVYAPTTEKAKKFPQQLDKFYANLDKLCKQVKKISTTVTIIAGDFNAKIGKRTGEEECIGTWSRGKRNDSGRKLVEFCENQKRLISNSCFQHPAKHITTWSQQRTDSEGNTANIYNQIDYIITDLQQKHTLNDARAYPGTETYSDHRLVVTRMQVKWATLYKKYTTPKTTPKIDTSKLIHDVDTQQQYQQQIQQKINTSNNEQAQTAAQRWEQVKEIIKNTAEQCIGHIANPHKNQIADEQMKKMSEKQKDIRLNIENSKNKNQIQSLKKERKTTLKNMKKRKKELREKQIDEILNFVDTTKDDNKMFKAAKALHTKRKRIDYVHDEKGKSVNNPQGKYDVINKYFKTQFQQPNQTPVIKFQTPPKRLRRQITADEIRRAAAKMSNNKSPGADNIIVELFKYAPDELYDELKTILNKLFEQNDDELKLGKGVLLPLPKPKKPHGPVKNLRPITLLEIIRKLLSKIFMNRTEDKINSSLSHSQSAYRHSRSTTDIVWSYRWIAAKAQKETVSIFSTGIDMSSAFDTIHRDDIIQINNRILDEDEMRMLRVLLADTTLEIKVDNAQSTPFTSNIGSPQGDCISGPMFTLVLNEAIIEIRNYINDSPIDARHINPKYIEATKSNLPEDIQYADDCDFLTELEKKQELQMKAINQTLTKFNLQINASKTEKTVIERKPKKTDEKWRDVIKLGSKIGDQEDIKRRKDLATAAMKDNDNLWKKQWTASIKKRLQLYKSLIESILLYNCGTWGLTTSDERTLDSFHRKQLRKVLGVKWPHRITNKKLYKLTNSKEISKTIAERRWKLFGHILRLHPETPARKAMQYYFELRSTTKKFRGRPRTTIVSTINRDIRNTRNKDISFPVTELISQVSLQNVAHKARNRKLWARIVKTVLASAYSS